MQAAVSANFLPVVLKPWLPQITWTSTVAEHGETTTLEDTASGFSYEPEAAWSTDLEAVLLSGFSFGNGQCVRLVLDPSIFLSPTRTFPASQSSTVPPRP
jgi:hypothetical protein